MMLQGVSPPTANSGDAAASAPATETPAAANAAASSGFSEDERGRTEDGGRSSGGNRWPRQETLYLLKIRQDMDVAFRDSSLKGPLWDEVSRKLALLGFHRSAKKCREKFENVYKYHKRIKDGRNSKSDGKTYKFFDQLEALEATPVVSSMPDTQFPSVPQVVTPPVLLQNNVDPISVAAPAVAMPVSHGVRFPLSGSSSSSTSSDDDELPRGRKRKWKEFFGRLMKEVVDKQEELQMKFLDSLERRERDRMAREEAWRMQEMAKMKREHELLVQERSMVAAKDAAVISFLQKIADQNPNSGIPQMPAMQLLHQQQQNQPPAPAVQQQQQQPQQPSQQLQPQSQPEQTPACLAVLATVPVVPVPVSAPTPATQAPPMVKNLDNGGGGENVLQPSPSRWPKAEINALIQIRTSLDTKYQENGPKGPLWEEVSSAMRNLGYNRNAKRCKEKWENINKYYKKVKESSKKRPEDSKTCPYFHQLDAIYREKAIGSNNSNNNNNIPFGVKPETQMAPIMARPEQQWPLPATIQEQQQQQQQLRVNEHIGIEDHRNADMNEDDYDDDEDEDDEEDEEGGDYEIVPNKTSSMAAVE
ncbi:hypothetical protein E3N88_15257 [Mikania micrantha]|uniref:Myb-like domain-containing protein n=1 Tax=Mikania micrantha TaxID=192012 RepID=A0A5N6NWB2_9ASTR|nr:hypothetical protein E3N88_15257 [Mikania micrantha]